MYILIVKNVLLTHELVKNYHRKKISTCCMINADSVKEFDSVNRDSFFLLLKLIHVPDKFIIWLKACVAPSYFSVNLKGGSEGFFKGRNV